MPTDVVPLMSDVTQILSAIEQGDPKAAEHLLPLVYDELRRLAAQKLALENPGQTLQATALVHDAYLRLVKVNEAQNWNSKGHFFAAAAEAMRRILIENARRKHALKRGVHLERVNLEDVEAAILTDGETLLLVNEALAKLEQEDPEAAQLVKLRFFAGMTNEEAGQALGVSARTAKRYWTFARAWLFRELRRPTRERGSVRAWERGLGNGSATPDIADRLPGWHFSARLCALMVKNDDGHSEKQRP